MPVLQAFSFFELIIQTNVSQQSVKNLITGHGGARAAQYCKDNLLNYVLQDSEFLVDPAEAMKNSFIRWVIVTFGCNPNCTQLIWLYDGNRIYFTRRTDAEFSSIARQRVMSDGTTAVTALIHNKRIYVANAGDSRAIVVQQGGQAKHLSVDHKPNRYRVALTDCPLNDTSRQMCVLLADEKRLIYPPTVCYLRTIKIHKHCIYLKKP